jgi:UDP-glucose 4-epimerase
MQILSLDAERNTAGSVVLIFGLGMIGSAISASLRQLNFSREAEIAYDWSDKNQRTRAQCKIEDACRMVSSEPAKLAVVWSAGSAAFHSTTDEAAKEQDAFEDTTTFTKKLRQRVNPKQFTFHFMSSAGGLFEGQRVVNFDSIPNPIRPYGHLKLAQEKLLMSFFNPHELVFYRPSSVYGPMHQRTQKGLINNLVRNGRSERVTVLDARIMSLRDYVFSYDIGKYVARSIRFSKVQFEPTERFLVSSRCSSIFEVVKKIERVLNLSLRVRYDVNFGNHRNITFSDRILPKNWRPSSLEVGLRQFLIDSSVT